MTSVEKPTNKKSLKRNKTPRAAKKRRQIVTNGIVHIQATYNNTIISITDTNGNVLSWSSAGQVGFKGPRKSTPYAAGTVIKNLMEKIAPFGMKEVDVRVRGVGSGREAAIRALVAAGLNVLTIKDVTPIPHNGPRAPKPRRV